MPERVEAAIGAAIEVRAAQPWQARRLTEIAFAAKRHWGYPEAWIRLWWDELVVTPGYVREASVLVALRGGRVAGWGAAGLDDGRWWIEHLWVEPSSIGCGVGTRLLTRIGEVLAARGVHRLVIAADPNAAGFYASRGAVHVGEIDSLPKGRRIPVYELDF